MLTFVDDAIDYAVEKGAKIINMSFGGAYDSGIEDAIEDAYHNHGVVFVASTGNYPQGTSAVRFPAYTDHVIAVGSTSTNDSKSSFSCYGSEIDISAPGENIYSTTLNNGYGNAGNGTSFAAPQVSATAALLLSIDPSLTPDEIRTILVSTAEKVGGYNYNWDQNHPGHSIQLGYGRLNVGDAIAEIAPVITGSDYVCSSGSEFTVNYLHSGDTITWLCSSNIDMVSNQGSNPCEFVTNDKGLGWINSTITNGVQYDLIKKYVWSGTPLVPYNMYHYDPLCKDTEIRFFFTEPGNLFQCTYHWAIQSEYYAYLYENLNNAYVFCSGSEYITLTVRPENECGTSDYYLSDPFFIDDCSFKMVLSPNPATDKLKIELSVDPSGDAIMEIINSQAIKVMSTSFSGKEKTIDISNLQKGVYYISVFNKGKINTGRFIKE